MRAFGVRRYRYTRVTMYNAGEQRAPACRYMYRGGQSLILSFCRAYGVSGYIRQCLKHRAFCFRERSGFYDLPR